MAYGFAAVLLCSALLKAAVPVTRDPSPGLSGLAIPIELLMAVWLISGLAGRWSRYASLLMLMVFVGVNAAHWWAGRDTCGCFGRIRVHPGITMVFDFIVLVLFAATHRRASLGRPQPSLARVCVAVVIGLLATGSVVTAVWWAPLPARVRIFDRDIRIGGPFPLLASLDPDARADLSHGRRTVVLYDHGCDHCRQYLDTLGFAPVVDLRVADVSDSPVSDDRFRPLRIPPTVDMAVTVPLRLELFNGNVEAQIQPR